MPNFINKSIIVCAQWSGNESVTHACPPDGQLFFPLTTMPDSNSCRGWKWLFFCIIIYSNQFSLFFFSEIYSKLTQNDIVQARPAVLHFGGFELGKTFKRTLHLANVSTEVQRMHIIPPQTRYFNIKYTKGVGIYYIM